MDPAEQELFAGSIGRAVGAHAGADLDAELEAVGWTQALAADPRTAVSVLFEAQGAAGVTSSALGLVLAAGLGLEPSAGTAVVLPALGSRQPPGRLDRATLVVAGLGPAPLASATTALVATGAATFPVATGRLTLRTVHGVDPELGLMEVAARLAGPPDPVGTLDAARWAGAVAAAQLAVGHELVGAARAVLELARRHALERQQFGRPVAAFQAVRHRLAETLVAVESAEAVLGAAWEDGEPSTAAVAKALAGRGARTAARHAQQVLAGIGFTTEHGFHRYLRRVLVLDELFGPARVLTGELGARLLATRALPALSPL